MPELIDHPRTQGAQPPPERLRPATTPGHVGEDARRRARGDLRTQIAGLERELAELFASAFPRRGVSYAVPAAGGPRILGVAELERTRDALAARVQEVRGWLSDCGYVEERNRELLERVIAEPESFPWVQISNEDIGEPGCRHWHSRPRWGLLGMVMGWWRVKLSSGCPLATGRGPAAAPRSPDNGEEAKAPRGAAARRAPSRPHRRAAGAPRRRRRPASRQGGRPAAGAVGVVPARRARHPHRRSSCSCSASSSAAAAARS